MLSALFHLIFWSFSNFYHFLGYFLVWIAWNPKVNFTYSTNFQRFVYSDNVEFMDSVSDSMGFTKT